MSGIATGPLYGAIDVPSGAWGLDSIIVGALTDEQLRALAEYDLASLGLKPSTWLPESPMKTSARPRGRRLKGRKPIQASEPASANASEM